MKWCYFITFRHQKLEDYPCEQFTEVYWIKYRKTQAARYRLLLVLVISIVFFIISNKGLSKEAFRCRSRIVIETKISQSQFSHPSFNYKAPSIIGERFFSLFLSSLLPVVKPQVSWSKKIRSPHLSSKKR